MVESQPQTTLELLQPLITTEPKRYSLLDIVTFSSQIEVLQKIDYPVGSYCLLRKDDKTAAFNIDSFYRHINVLHSPFQDPNITDLIFSELFLERTRNGNSQRINLDRLPGIVVGWPNYAQRDFNVNLDKILKAA